MFNRNGVIVATTEQAIQDALFVRKKVFVTAIHYLLYPLFQFKEKGGKMKLAIEIPIELEIDEHENDSTHFVLYDKEKPVGADRFRLLDHRGKVERICILPTTRKKGAGAQPMKAIEFYAKDQAIVMLTMNAQTYAIPFYEKLHYKSFLKSFWMQVFPIVQWKKVYRS